MAAVVPDLELTVTGILQALLAQAAAAAVAGVRSYLAANPNAIRDFITSLFGGAKTAVTSDPVQTELRKLTPHLTAAVRSLVAPAGD